MNVIWDKGTHLMVEETDYRGRLKKRRVQRFLCIGGKLHGLWRAGFELPTAPHKVQHYRLFNNAGCSQHSAIWVWIN